MVLVTAKHLKKIAATYPDAAADIERWANLIEVARWQNIVELRATYKDADEVGGYVVFNIRRNRYRLITVIHFSKKGADGRTTQGHVYIRSFLTHKQYNNPANWDKEFGS